MINNKHTTCPDPDASGREGHDYLKNQLMCVCDSNCGCSPAYAGTLEKQIKK